LLLGARRARRRFRCAMAQELSTQRRHELVLCCASLQPASRHPPSPKRHSLSIRSSSASHPAAAAFWARLVALRVAHLSQSYQSHARLVATTRPSPPLLPRTLARAVAPPTWLRHNLDRRCRTVTNLPLRTCTSRRHPTPVATPRQRARLSTTDWLHQRDAP
jgi:hypothetical protein